MLLNKAASNEFNKGVQRMSKLDGKFNVGQTYTYKDVYRFFPKAYCDICLIRGEYFYHQRVKNDGYDVYIGEHEFCPARIRYRGNGSFISTSSGNEFVFYLTNNH